LKIGIMGITKTPINRIYPAFQHSIIPIPFTPTFYSSIPSPPFHYSIPLVYHSIVSAFPLLIKCPLLEVRGHFVRRFVFRDIGGYAIDIFLPVVIY